MAVLVGIVGKPSSGKTTFLNALCHTEAKTADYPFTTIEPNKGVAYISTTCVHTDLGLDSCDPRNSTCSEGIRRIPVKIIDVAGLVPDAHKGKGLGNKFLGDLAEANALIHVVDISGSLDSHGEAVEPGSWDPLDDIDFLRREIDYWMLGIMKKGWDRIARRSFSEKIPIAELIFEKLSGLKISRVHINQALRKANLSSDPRQWTDEVLLRFVEIVRDVSKPILIAANKIDRPTSKQNLERLREKLGDDRVVATSALAENLLQKLTELEKIRYETASGHLEFVGKVPMSENEESSVKRIESEILNTYGSTGVLECLNKVILEILAIITVYPVADSSNFSDNDGRVLPDVFLMEKGKSPRDLAQEIHADLATNFIHALDAKMNRRISDTYELQDRDVIRIVSAAK